VPALSNNIFIFLEQMLESTKVSTNGYKLIGSKFNKKENQCEHPFWSSDQLNCPHGSLAKTYRFTHLKFAI
jgi:hypothetical protein